MKQYPNKTILLLFTVFVRSLTMRKINLMHNRLFCFQRTLLHMNLGFANQDSELHQNPQKS